MLFRFAGIVPDEIESLGSCEDCQHASFHNGQWSERGYVGPCSPCKRPRMSNFVPRQGRCELTSPRGVRCNLGAGHTEDRCAFERP